LETWSSIAHLQGSWREEDNSIRRSVKTKSALPHTPQNRGTERADSPVTAYNIPGITRELNTQNITASFRLQML
jgi:hypothetical protein